MRFEKCDFHRIAYIFSQPRFASYLLQERIHLSFPPKGGGLLRLPRAFSATLTGRFGMGTVRMGAEGRW
jgi:hypothetical protein